MAAQIIIVSIYSIQFIPINPFIRNIFQHSPATQFFNQENLMCSHRNQLLLLQCHDIHLKKGDYQLFFFLDLQEGLTIFLNLYIWLNAQIVPKNKYVAFFNIFISFCREFDKKLTIAHVIMLIILLIFQVSNLLFRNLFVLRQEFKHRILGQQTQQSLSDKPISYKFTVIHQLYAFFTIGS